MWSSPGAAGDAGDVPSYSSMQKQIEKKGSLSKRQKNWLASSIFVAFVVASVAVFFMMQGQGDRVCGGWVGGGGGGADYDPLTLQTNN